MILAMMRFKWSVRAKVIIARGGGGSEDFGEDHMVSRGDGVDYKYFTANEEGGGRGGFVRILQNLMGWGGQVNFICHTQNSPISLPHPWRYDR